MKIKRILSAFLIAYFLVFLLPATVLVQPALAVAATTPVVEDALATDTTKPVVVIASGVQTGYQTLAAAFAAIGNGTDDYTVVFTQDYTMAASTDMNAMAANGENAASLNITSAYATVSAPGVQIAPKKVVISAGANSLLFCWTLNTDAVIHDINFAITGACVNMYGCGHDLTMGENITVTSVANNGRVQLYGGANAALTADTHLTVLSGTYSYIFGGNFNGVLTGNTEVHVGGASTITNLYGASQINPLDPGYNSSVYVDGTDGAAVTTVRGSFKVDGIPAASQIDVYLNNVSVRDIDPKNGTAGTSAVHVSGNCSVSGPTNATNLTIESSAQLISTGILALSGDLTLEADAQYFSRSANAQTVGGNLNVTGANAGITLYKVNATTAPVKMTVKGDYTHPENPMQLAFNNNPGASISPTTPGGDILLSYTTAANASGSDYKVIYDNASGTCYAPTESGGNIILTPSYSYPTWYIPLSGTDGLFYYNEVGNTTATDGGTRPVYRKYDISSGNWFASDATGSILDPGSPLTQSDIDKERPQPDALHPSDVDVAAKATMIRIDALGNYRITATAGTNATGVVPDIGSYGSASGRPDTLVNIDGKGKSNASWAVLNQTNSSCEIYKAYLVMTTTLYGSSSAATAKALLNKPMTLQALNGDTMQSNGYLPEGFSVAKIGSGGTGFTALTSDAPTILTDHSIGSLGEAMTVTDVTDFIKAHGYGKYYGIDIPTSGTDVDAAIGWRLVVLENDPTMEYIRKVSLQMGPVSNYAGTTTMDVSLDGYTTPDSGSFGGQVLLIGSDNTGRLPTGGDSTASNVYATYYPDSTKTAVAIKVGTNDPSTEMVVDRPAGSWSQGFMEVDGIRLPADEVSHMTAEGGMGIDLSLLNVTNEQNTTWETTGGHNLYLTPSSPSVRITSTKDLRGIGYFDVIGLSVDIALPAFEAEITHSDLGTPPAEGVDILAGNAVAIHATVTNVMPVTSLINGSLNTKVVVKADPVLCNLRGMDGGAIVATYHDHDGGSVTDHTVFGDYDPDTHTITFDFGSNHVDPDSGDIFPLYNDRDDALEIHFLADTDLAETLSNPDLNYVNKVSISGKDIYLNYKHVEMPRTEYDHDDDDFDTYKNFTRFSKQVTGALGDQMMPFTFTLTPKNPANGTLPEGTVLSYTGGVLDGIDAARPEDGTLSVDANGQVSFTLRHGQYIEIQNIPTGTIDIKETFVYEESGVSHKQDIAFLGYAANCYDNKSGIGYTAMPGGDIPGIGIGKNETGRQINILNTKDMSPPTGINLPNTCAFLLALLIGILGLGVWHLNFSICKKHGNRK